MNQVPSSGMVVAWTPFVGPFDPCPPKTVKTYVLPPNVFHHFQPPGLPQFSPIEALKRGTLWPAYFNDYTKRG